MEITPETARAGRRKREGWRSLFKKGPSRSENAGPPARPAGVSEVKNDAQHVASTTSSEAQSVDAGVPPSVDAAVMTEPDLQEKSADQVSDQQQIQDPDLVVETPDQPSAHPEISSFPQKETEARSDDSQQPAGVPLTVSETLWDEAYRAVQRDHRSMVRLYETILSTGLDKTAPDLSPHIPTFDIFENLVSQRDPKARQAQMKELLDAWLSEEDDVENAESVDSDQPRQDEGTDGASLLTPSLQGIIRKVIEATPTEAVLALVGACYASKILLHPKVDNQEDCSGVIYVISRMEWYSRLPKLLEKRHVNGIDNHGDLSSRIIDLYAAVLSYLMKLVCSHFGSLAFDFPSDIFLPRFRSVTLKTVNRAEEVLPLFNEDQVKLPLERLLDGARKERTASDHENEQRSEENKELLNDLHVVDPRPGMLTPHREQSQVMHELYHLLLSTKEYKCFLDWDTPSHQMLWISGDAGQGKTMLLTSVVQVLLGQKEEVDDCQDVSFFFFDYSRPEYDNAAAALKNLMWLLLVQQPSLAHHLDAKRETMGRKHFDDPNDFLALSGVFYDMIEDDDFSKMYFVVDALEECSSDERRPGLDDFVGLIITSTKLSKKIRWLVSGRYSEKLKIAFEGCSGQHLGLSADLHGSSVVVNNYIRDMVSRLAIDKAYDEELETIVADALCMKIPDNYLWVNIVCTALQDEEIWHVNGFLKEIEDIKDLKSLYHHMERKIRDLPKDSELCMEVLGVMAVVCRSLHVDELKPLVHLPPRVDLMAILRKCSAFLQIHDNNVVSFQHQSARNHVRKHLLDRTSIYLSHMQLTRSCLDSLANSLGERGTHGTYNVRTNSAYDGRDETLATGDYASLHWMTHLYGASKSPDDIKFGQGSQCNEINDKVQWDQTSEKVQWFLDEHFLSWVDALVADEQLPIAAVKMQKVDLCLQEMLPNWKEMHGAIRDAHLFLRLHQSTGSPRDLAASNSLLFCPAESNIRKSCMTKVLPWVAVPPKMDQYWAHNFATFEGHQDWIRTIAFSPDGRLIASGSDDSTVRIWDAETGTTQHSVEVRRGWVYCVAFSSQGIVAAGSDDYSVTMWEVSTGREIAHLPDHEGTLNALCFSPDGTKLAAASSWTMWLWEAQSKDFKDWECKETVAHDDTVRSVVFSADGRLLATGTDDCKIRLWDAEARTLLRVFEGHESQVNTVAFSRDGKLLASGAEDGTAGIWDANSADPWSGGEGESERVAEKVERRLHTLKLDNWEVNSVAFSPDDEGSRLATATNNAIHVWDTKAGTKLQVIHSLSSDVRSAAFAPGGSYIASGSSDYGVHLWYASGEPRNAVPVSQLPRQSGVYEMAVSPDGRTIAGVQSDDSVFLWDVQADELIQRDMQFGHSRSVCSLAFSPDGKLLASTSKDESVRVCVVATGKRLHVFNGHSDWVRSAAWCDSGAYIVSASDDSSIRVWKIGGAEFGESIQVLAGPHEGSYVQCVTCSPDGKYIASGGNNKVVVWERSKEGSWEEKTTHTSHTDDVLSVLLTMDQKRVISASSDSTVRIWDIETGKETQPPIKVDWVFYKMWFPLRSDEYVMTPQGALSLRYSSGASRPPVHSPWRLKYDTEERQWWITFEDRNVVFLPGKFRPISACVLGNKVVVGTSSAHMHVYTFSKDLFPRHEKTSILNVVDT